MPIGARARVLFHLLAFGCLLTLSSGARVVEAAEVRVSGERISACGAGLRELDPAEHLPGEVATVFASDCPEGTVFCKAACCRCCDPDGMWVCCLSTCTSACIDQCPACG